MESKMTYEQIKAFTVLGLPPDAGEMEIKRAYARKLKTCNPETNPEAWMSLHDAYEKALTASKEDRSDLFYDEDEYDDKFTNLFETSTNEQEQEQESEYDSFFKDIEELSSESEANYKLGYISIKLSSTITLNLKHSMKPDGTLIITGIEIQKPQKSLSNRTFSLEIPEYINGYPVTEIGTSALSSCHILKEVVISDSVVKIGKFAFFNCICLENVKLPYSLITIDDKAFEDCDSLRRIDIPNGTSRIGDKAFSGCIFLEDVYIPPSVKHIGKDAFDGCVMLNVFEREGSYKVYSDIFASDEIQRKKLNIYSIGEGFELIDAGRKFERVHDIRKYAYIFIDERTGVELGIIDDGRKRLGLTDGMLAKKILAGSPMIPKGIYLERNLDVCRGMIWCEYSFDVITPTEGALKFFGGLVVCNSYVLHISSSTQSYIGNSDMERISNLGGISNFVRSLRPKIN